MKNKFIPKWKTYKKCLDCGKILGDYLRFDPDNCRTLCILCHYFITFKKVMPENNKWGRGHRKYE